MKIILFDFFGVLSTFVYMKVIRKYIPENEHTEWLKKLDLIDIGDLSENELVKQISEKAKVDEDEIWLEVKNAPVVNNELINFIENKLKNKYKVGLLTNIPRSLIERIIPEKLNIFDLVLISSDLKLIKPSKEIFEVAIQRSGCLPNDILFIDDGEKNIEVAKSLGFNTILYKDLPSFIDEIQKILVI